jgi:hypothetical protein
MRKIAVSFCGSRGLKGLSPNFSNEIGRGRASSHVFEGLRKNKATLPDIEAIAAEEVDQAGGMHVSALVAWRFCRIARIFSRAWPSLPT